MNSDETKNNKNISDIFNKIDEFDPEGIGIDSKEQDQSDFAKYREEGLELQLEKARNSNKEAVTKQELRDKYVPKMTNYLKISFVLLMLLILGEMLCPVSLLPSEVIIALITAFAVHFLSVFAIVLRYIFSPNEN